MTKVTVAQQKSVNQVKVYRKPQSPRTHKNIAEKLENILALPKHIVNLRFCLHSVNGVEYTGLRATCNGRTIRLGRVYRYVFFPTKHMNYYKHKASNLKININDYLDGVIAGKYPLCPNKADYLYSDVDLLKDYPEFYVKRDGVFYGSHQLDELIELEKFNRKRNRTINNIYPDVLSNLAEHVKTMEGLYGYMDVSPNKLVKLVKQPNDSKNDIVPEDNTVKKDYLAHEDKTAKNHIVHEYNIVKDDSSNSNNQLTYSNVSLPYVDSSKINLYNGDSDLSIAYDKDDTDYLSEIIYDDEYLDKLSNNNKYNYLTHALSGVTDININKVLAEQPGPKTAGKIPLNPVISKNFYTSLLLDHFLKYSGLVEDIPKSLEISGVVDKEEIEHYTKLILALISVNFIQGSLVYTGGIATQMQYPLGLDIHLNDSQFIKTMKVIGNEAFLHAFNQCRYDRLKPEEGLFCDHTSVSHKCNNNDYSTLMFSSDKKFIKGASSTIAISDRTHIPVLFKIYPGNTSDFTIGSHLLSLFSIEDTKKKITSIVVDRGYSSRNNLYLAYSSDVNLITASRRTDGVRKDLIQKNAAKMLKHTFKYRIPKNSKLLAVTELIELEVPNPVNDKEMISFPVYAHVICDTNTRHIEQEQFDKAIMTAIERIAGCNSIAELEQLLDKNPKIRTIIKEYDTNPLHVNKGKINTIALFNDRNRLELDEDKIASDSDVLGFMVNYSTKEITAEKCHRYYLNRNFIEGLNKHSKTTLDSGTGRSHSTETYIGRQTITFMTSILTTTVKTSMSGVYYDDLGNQLPVNKEFSNRFTTIKELLSQLNSSKLLINLENQEWKLQDLNKSLIKYLKYLGIDDVNQQSKEMLEKIIGNEIKVSISLLTE